MPRFSDDEKEIIRHRLLGEGEKLFTAHGIKKVTVDDLVHAAGIAKGSFYSFYINKEHLYMDICQRIQQQMWNGLDGFLENNKALPPKELTKNVFMWMLQFSRQYPILNQTNSDTLDYLFRKLPPEIIEEHVQEDGAALMKLTHYGISFNCSTELAAKALQALYFAIARLEEEDIAEKEAVTEILVNGVIDQIVRDRQ